MVEASKDYETYKGKCKLSDIIRYYPILTKHVLKLKRIRTAGLEKTFTKFIVIFVQQK